MSSSLTSSERIDVLLCEVRYFLKMSKDLLDTHTPVHAQKRAHTSFQQ